MGAFDDLIRDNRGAFDDLVDAEDRARAKRPGLLSEVGSQVKDAFWYHLPGAIASALEGTEPFKERDWKDALIERSRQRSEEVGAQPGAQDPLAFGALSRDDVRSLGPSLAFSGVGAGAGVGVGIPAGIAGAFAGGPAAPITGPVAGFAAGSAASGKAAYNMATNQFLRDARRKEDDLAMKERGVVLTDAEWANVEPAYIEQAKEYGLWEAVPEAASNAIGAGILLSPAKRLVPKMLKSAVDKNIVTRGATKLGLMEAAELPSETVTQMGQHNIETATGVNSEPGAQPRSMTSPGDWWDSFKEIVGPVALQTTLMGGAGGAAVGLHRALRPEPGPIEVVPARTPEDQRLREVARAVEQREIREMQQETEGAPGEEAAPAAAAEPGTPGAPAAPDEGLDAALRAVKAGQQVSPEDAARLTQGGLAAQKKDGTLRVLPAGRRRLTELDRRAHEGASSPTNDLPEPTDDQIEANNAKLGHIKVSGLDISVENAAGSTRSDKANKPPKWTQQMQDHYGYVKGVPARAPDKERVDIFVKPGTAEDFGGDVFVVDQQTQKGDWDEPKVMVGYASQQEAQDAYHRNYQAGWKGMRDVTAMPIATFKQKLQDPNAFMRPQRPALWVKGAAPASPVKPPAAAPAEKRPDDISRIGEAGKAMIDGLYDHLWKAFQAGRTDEAGQPSTVLQAAAFIKRHGGAVTRENFPAIAADVTTVKDRGLTGEPYQVAMREVLKKHLPQKPGDTVGHTPDGREIVRMPEGGTAEIPHRDPKEGTSIVVDTSKKETKRDDEPKQLPAPDEQGAQQKPQQGAGRAEEPKPAAPAVPAAAQGKVAPPATRAEGVHPANGGFQAIDDKGAILGGGEPTYSTRELAQKTFDRWKQTGARSAAEAEKQRAPSFGATNKIFTADAAAKARELLRKKLSGTVNAGLDPEIVQAGIQLAGYYIEGGARTFAEYSAKMIGDLGQAVKPYLKSWYLAVRNYPGFGNEGMQSEAQLEQEAAAPSKQPESDQKAAKTEQKPTESPSNEKIEGPQGERDRPSVNSDLAAERQKDHRGLFIYKKGERIEFFDGVNAGRHGEISEVSSYVMRPIFGAGGVSETNYSYQVKTDNGADVHGDAREFKPETSKPERVVPDIKYANNWSRPSQVWQSYLSAKKNARDARENQARARLPEKKRGWVREAERSDSNAAIALEAFNAWAEKYPEEAKAIRGEKPAAAAPAAPASTPAAEGMPAMTLHADRKHGKTGATIHVVSLNDRVERDVYERMKARASGLGGRYSSYRGGGAIPGFEFKDLAKAKEFMGQGVESEVRAVGQAPSAPGTDTRPTETAAQKPEPAAAASGAQSAGAPLRPEPVEEVSAAAIRPPNKRWENDPGSIPGEPVLYLDAHHDFDTAKAGIIEREQDGGGVLYEAMVPGGRSLGLWPTVEQAAAGAERVFPAEETDSGTPAPVETAPTQADNETEATDERPKPGSESPRPLGEVAAEEDGGTEGERPARGGDARRGGDGAERDREPDAERVPSPRSGGGGAEAVHFARPRAGGGTGRLGARRARREGNAAPAGEVAPQAPTVPGINYRITDEVRLGQGGEVEKFRDNLAAIRTLKAIEKEGRRATPEEQRTLARYVGWGGLANAFADDKGSFKDAWEQRGKDLADLLTAPELRAARRSTRNAHYTSEAVVDAIWEAVLRFGYKGGLVLESSMGTGNFIGLMPEEVLGDSKVIGVEYDSLTSRIAHALYPQATVLHSGFQKVPLPDGEFDLNIGNPPFGAESLRFQYKPELQGKSIHNQFFLAGLDALKPGGIQAMVVSRYLMDAQDGASREALAKKAKLLGAIRLPDTAFKENARTEVVTDILFFQRLSPSEESSMEAIIDAKRSGPLKGDKERERRALARLAPDWIDTSKVRDPLGGEDMVVNQYFVDNTDMILGTLERSGKMRAEGEVNVRIEKGVDLAELLEQAVARLPENVVEQGPDAIARSKERFESMSQSLKIAISGQEAGSIVAEDGKIMQVLDRETPSGDFELTKRELSPRAPWSPQLLLDATGKWYRLEVQTDADGKPVKVEKLGKKTKLNAYVRTVYEAEADIPEALRMGEARFERLKKLVTLRDLLKKQLVMEAEDAKAEDMEGNREALAGAYRKFVDAHGFINAPANASLVSEMPDGALVLAIELAYRPEITEAMAKRMGERPRAAIATPAPILKERVVVPYSPPGKADTPADALAITLSESGRVDIARISGLLGLTEDEAIANMAEKPEKPLIFRDPESNTWETRDAYLSGPVKRKLAAARAAGLDKNIEALEKVQPEQWGADKVTAIIGSSWIPPDVYAGFVQHITGAEASVSYSALTNSYAVSGNGATQQAKEWGTDDASPTWLINQMLNSSAIRITYTDNDGKVHLNQEATALAQLKAKQIETEFADWVFQDGDRRNKLIEIFNEKFNTRVNRQFDGGHLKLPGKVPDAVIAMRRHQMNAIWRGISQRFNLYDHVVGAGKTYTAVARAMERRRMGLSKKPTVVVPNHLVEEWAASTYRLYPGAKVLAAGKADFQKKRRRKLFAKIATGDWDLVIMPHSSFGFIDIAPETEERFLDEELRLANQAIEDAWEEAKDLGMADGRRKPFNVKEAERLAEKIQGRMDSLKKSGKDRLLTFEQMGIDDLTIDEAHEFKNLFYSSRLTNVRGMNDKTGSQKAFDLYNKIRVLREHPTATVTFMTGTPISNSAVEMYQMMRYLAADDLKELGLEHFDAWRAQFVDASTKWEPTESGRLKEVNRLGRTWSNMRSLMDLYYSFTDAVSIDDIKKWYAEDNGGKQFPVPKVKGGDRQSVVVKATPAQKEKLEEILDGFDGLGGISDPYERNAERLRLMDRARKVSLDIRAVSPGHPSPEKGGKLEQVAERAAAIYKKWSKDKGTQLVFLDRSVPKAKGDDRIIKEYDRLIAERDKALSDGNEEAYRIANDALEKYDPNEIGELRTAQSAGWNAYDQIKRNLIARGVPAAEIRFIQEANNDQQKQAMFDAVNAGEVRILIGSTPRMGAGTNVQKRLVALHHVDVTWKPSDIEQREGRIIRQGNLLLDKYGDDFEVEILAYATERTVDAKLWDVNSTKLKTINGIRKYGGEFTMDFQDEEAISMAEIAALASGDPKLLERVKLDSDIDRLELLERAHKRKIWGIKDQIQTAERHLRENPGEIERQKSLAAKIDAKLKPIEEAREARRVTIEGQEYAKHFDAMTAAVEAIKAQKAGDEKARWALKVNGERITSQEALDEAVSNALGDSETFEAEVNGKTTYRRIGMARAIVNDANRLFMDLGGKRATESKEVGTLLGYKATLYVAKDKIGAEAELGIETEDGKTIATGRARDVMKGTAFSTQYIAAIVESAARQVFGGRSTYTDFLERDIKSAEENLPRLRKHESDPFEQAAELAEKRARLEAVIRDLASSEAAKQPETQVESDDEGDGAEAAFKRATDPGEGLEKAAVEKIIEPIVKRWANAPAIKVIGTFSEAPEGAQAKNREQIEGGATIAPAAFNHRGTIYVVADKVGTPYAVYRAIFHEALGHYGLRGVFDVNLGAVLDDVATAMPEEVQHAAEQYGLKWSDVDQQREAAEEVLATLAETRPRAGLVKRAIAAIRRFLRDLGLVHDLSENDIIVNFILPARRFVEEGPGKAMLPTDDIRFQRAPEGEAFDKWFGDSKVVDADGKPLVVYHGTKAEKDFTEFKTPAHFGSAAQANDIATSWRFFAPTAARGVSDRVMPVYLSIQNPLEIRDSGVEHDAEGLMRAARETGEVEFRHSEEILYEEGGGERRSEADAMEHLVDHLSGRGYDGFVYENTAEGGGGRSYVAFYPEQIKSAIGNVGAYNPMDPDIRFQRPGVLEGDMREAVGNLFESQRTFNRWWHRTVGTQFHKARHDADFRRVFNLGQDYLTDTSRYAMKSEAEAPDLLLRLEGAGDVFKRGISGKDKEAIAKPIFQGTLDNQTYTDDELRSVYGLTDRQVEYYRQFRASVDQSLNELAKSTMGKMATGIGIRMSAVRDIRELPLQEFHSELMALMRTRANALKDMLDQMADTDPGRALANERYKSAKSQVTATTKLFNRVEQLKGEGYAPLMRFGEYTVYVKEGDEQIFFGLYETQRQANAAAKALAAEYPDADVTQGILSKEAWRVFQGLSPDTVEVFAKAAGLEGEPLFQEYLRLAVNNRSALKRLIHRKGVPGFSDDVTRVLASFVTSNARLTSSNYHMGEMQAAVDAIPREKGDVRDEAVKLWKYLADPTEEAGPLRGYLFFQFLGGSLASALVNATQPITMTAPYLVKYTSAANVAAELGKAAMEAAKNKPGADVRQAYDRAVEEGLVAPHEIYQMMAQARGNAMGATGIGRFMKVWGSFFSLAEAFNRRATFIAAYRIAQKEGMARPYEFAKQAVHETQGLYNKGNRPNWARGPVGSTVFTFKQFSIAYVEFLKRLHDTNKPAFWTAIAVLWIAAGLEGLPFAEDIEDIIDTIGQWLGHSTNSKKWLRDQASEALGDGAADFVLHGFSAIPGFPLDVSARMGLHNIIPGTALFKRSESAEGKAREALEILGPAGGVVQSGGRALEAAARGDTLGAARAVMPSALANLFKGAEMWEKGYYTDSRGRRVIDTDGSEAILKAAGFQPAEVARESRNIEIAKSDIDLHRSTESSIADKMARAIVDKKPEQLQEARDELKEWNERNPDSRIFIEPSQVNRRVLEMRRTRAERFVRSAPKEMRQEVRREISR